MHQNICWKKTEGKVMRKAISFLIASLSIGLITSCGKQFSALKHDHADQDPINLADLKEPEAAAELTYYKDIRAIIENKCTSCHRPEGLAPFSLIDYESVHTFRYAIRDAVIHRRMPPWLADDGYQVYKDSAALTTEELSKLVYWIDFGAMEGNAEDYQPVELVQFQADIVIPVFQKELAYTPPIERNDDYRCFLVPLDQMEEQLSYITGFSVVPGNTKIVHHLVAYIASAEIADYLQRFDEEEAGMGYECFGGALPDRLGDLELQAKLEAEDPGILAKLNSSHYWLAHWAPGMEGGFNFPVNTGVKIPKDSVMVVQMHYYNAFAKGESDSGTVFGLKLAEQVEKPGFFYPLTNPLWLLARQNQSMIIPANSRATFSTEVSMQDVVDYGRHILGSDSQLKNLEIHSANIHMHSFGESATASIKKVKEEEEILLRISHWNLHWQRDFQFENPILIPEERLDLWSHKVSCNYNNPGDEPVYGGFGSLDEMCINFSYFAFDLEE